MDNRNAKIQLVIDFLKSEMYKEGNEWIINELNINTQINQIYLNSNQIIKFLSIEPKLSIDYEYIEHRLLRTRLELDNLRMENSFLNVKDKDIVRKFEFIVNAFYQVENLLNYYFHCNFPIIEDLLNHLEIQTKSSSYINKTTGISTSLQFKRKDKPYKSVSDIDVVDKIKAFSFEFFNNDFETSLNLNLLRQARNEGVHRCEVILKDESSSKKSLQKFITSNTYDTTRNTLKTLNSIIKQNLKKQ